MVGRLFPSPCSLSASSHLGFFLYADLLSHLQTLHTLAYFCIRIPSTRDVLKCVGQEVVITPFSHPIRLRAAFRLVPIRASRLVGLPSWRLKTPAIFHQTATVEVFLLSYPSTLGLGQLRGVGYRGWDVSGTFEMLPSSLAAAVYKALIEIIHAPPSA